MPNLERTVISKVDTLPAAETQPSAEARAFHHHLGQVSRHSSVFFLGTIFTAAAGYLFKVYLARVLGAEALGIYALGMTIVGFVGLFNALGLPSAAVRFVAAYTATRQFAKLRAFLGRTLAVLLLSNLVLGAAVMVSGPWIALRFYHTPGIDPYMGLFVLIMVTGALNTYLGQVLGGYKDVARRTVITNFIGSPLTMVFTLALVAWGLGLWGYIFAQVASAAAVLGLLLFAAWRLTPPESRAVSGPLLPLDREVVSFSVAAFGVSFLEFLMAQADKVMIGFYLSARDVGIYAVAAALVVFVPIVLQSVNQIFSPTIADLHARGEIALLGRLFQTLTKWIIGFTFPLALVFIVFARPLMRIFGPDFEVGWLILAVGTLGQFVNCAVGSVGFLLLMSGNQRRLIRVQTLMAVGMVMMNILLIPRFGILGAALAAAFTNAITNVLYLREVKSALGLLPYNRTYLRLALPAVATAAALVVLRMLAKDLHPWIVLLSALAGSYAVFTGLAVTAGLDPDDRAVANAVYERIAGAWRRGMAR